MLVYLAALDLPRSDDLDGAALLAISERVLARSGLGAGHAPVYVQVTRGSAPRAHHYPDPGRVPPAVLVSASPFAPLDAVRAVGVRVITVPDVRWGRCDIKTVNLSTTSEVMPVAAVDDRTIGGGRPGPLTCQLAAALAARSGEAVLAGR